MPHCTQSQWQRTKKKTSSHSLKNIMCHVENDSYYTFVIVLRINKNACRQAALWPDRNTAVTAPTQQAALKLTALTAQSAEARSRFNLFYLFVNFRQPTRKNSQSFLDLRAKQKPSRRADFVNTAIKDSPGLIRGRLEQQRGRSLPVKAVCGGTLGWKDPPFNPILALPGATHQDPTNN